MGALDGGLQKILQLFHHLTVISADGMVLAIPLTQAAIGPFRSVFFTPASGR